MAEPAEPAGGRSAPVLPGPLGRIARRLRHRVALRRLRRLPRPSTILIVCTGNACRSPYLAAVLSARMPHIRIQSAGLLPSGLAAPPQARSMAAERGIDLSVHRSRRLVPATVAGVDLILVMTKRHQDAVRARYGADRVVLMTGDLDPDATLGREILDPYNGDVATFRHVFDRLDRCADVIARCFPPHRS